MEIYARSWLPSVFILFIFTLQLVRLGIESLRRSSPFFFRYEILFSIVEITTTTTMMDDRFLD